jgi:hypothetical protein
MRVAQNNGLGKLHHRIIANCTVTPCESWNYPRRSQNPVETDRVPCAGAGITYPLLWRLLDFAGQGVDVMAKAMTGTQESGWAWRLIAALVILAFCFQSYVAQTHIHKSATAVSAGLIHHAGPGESPGPNAPLDCPFCQVVNHAGSYLLSDAPLLLLASQWAQMVAPRHLVPDIYMVARHHWRSRAPPSP